MDYSEKERRQVMDVISLFDEKTTRDELGIASIGDAFSNQLFPGTSVVQTRARYFLFVPWIYQNLESRQVSSRDIGIRLRRDEVRLIDSLADSEDTSGVIGIRARANVQRLPSNVYWQGLGRWGIRSYHGSQDQYHRSLDAYYLRLNGRSRVMENDEGEPVDGHLPYNWHPYLPPPPPDFPKKESFALTTEEAEYLRDRVLSQAPGTLLAYMVDDNEELVATEAPWAYPDVTYLPPRIQAQLFHGKNFAHVMHGASLLYNLMLAELTQKQDLIDSYRDTLTLWWDRLVEMQGGLRRWRLEQFWRVVTQEGARISPLTKAFVVAWVEKATAALDGRGIGKSESAIWEDEACRLLISNREHVLKRDQARLHSRRALELWTEASGTDMLTYRWGTVQTLVSDILDGLSGGREHAQAS